MTKKQLDPALKSAQAALALSEKFGPDSACKAISLRELAEVMGARNQFDEAVSLLKLENRIVAKIPSSPLLIDNLKFTATVLWQESKVEESLDYERQALASMRAIYGNDNNYTVSQAGLIAQEEANIGPIKEMTQLKKNWLTRRDTLGASHIGTLKALFDMANWEHDRGKNSDALSHYKEAVQEGCHNPQAFYGVVAPALKSAAGLLHADKHDDQIAVLYTSALACKELSTDAKQRSLMLSDWFDTLVTWTDSLSRPSQLRQAAELALKLDALAAKTNDPVVKADAYCRDASLALSRDDKATAKTKCVQSLELCRTSPTPHFDTVRVAMEVFVNVAGCPPVIAYCKGQLAQSHGQVHLVPMRYFSLIWLAECELRSNGCHNPGRNSIADAGRIYSNLIKETEVASDRHLYGYCALRHAKVAFWKAIVSNDKTDIEAAIGSNQEFLKLEKTDAVMDSPATMASTCERIARLYILMRDGKSAGQWYDTALHSDPDPAYSAKIKDETDRYLEQPKTGKVSEQAALACRESAKSFNTCEENP